jgi:hypothetical protein
MKTSEKSDGMPGELQLVTRLKSEAQRHLDLPGRSDGFVRDAQSAQARADV